MISVKSTGRNSRSQRLPSSLTHPSPAELPSVIFYDVSESRDSSPQKRVHHDLSALKDIVNKCLPRGTPVIIAKASS